MCCNCNSSFDSFKRISFCSNHNQPQRGFHLHNAPLRWQCIMWVLSRAHQRCSEVKWHLQLLQSGLLLCLHHPEEVGQSTLSTLFLGIYPVHLPLVVAVLWCWGPQCCATADALCKTLQNHGPLLSAITACGLGCGGGGGGGGATSTALRRLLLSLGLKFPSSKLWLDSCKCTCNNIVCFGSAANKFVCTRFRIACRLYGLCRTYLLLFPVVQHCTVPYAAKLIRSSRLGLIVCLCLSLPMESVPI